MKTSSQCLASCVQSSHFPHYICRNVVFLPVLRSHLQLKQIRWQLTAQLAHTDTRRVNEAIIYARRRLIVALAIDQGRL